MGCAKEEPQNFIYPTHIQFDPSIPKYDQERIKESLGFLDSMSFDSNKTAELRELLKVSEVNANTLRGWVEERVHFIVGPDYDGHQNLKVGDLGGPVEVSPHQNGLAGVPGQGAQPYPPQSHPAQYPPQSQPSTQYPPHQYQPRNPNEVKVLMDNLGADLFIGCKSVDAKCKINIPGQSGLIPIKSPRIGIIREGKDLMTFIASFANYSNDPIAFLATLLSIMAHEGRHSDGNSKSNTLAFEHVNCPSGPYRGKPACDTTKGRPYSIGAEYLKAIVHSCKDCSQTTLTILRNRIADSEERVLDRRPISNLDDTPEEIQ